MIAAVISRRSFLTVRALYCGRRPLIRQFSVECRQQSDTVIYFQIQNCGERVGAQAKSEQCIAPSCCFCRSLLLLPCQGKKVNHVNIDPIRLLNSHFSRKCIFFKIWTHLHSKFLKNKIVYSNIHRATLLIPCRLVNVGLRGVEWITYNHKTVYNVPYRAINWYLPR